MIDGKRMNEIKAGPRLESQRKLDATRNRRLSRYFYGVAFDENHLAGLATKVKEATKLDCLRISVDSADEEESIRFERPDLFADASMPNKVKRVNIDAYSSSLGEDMNASVSLTPESAWLRVGSTDSIRARSVFLELEREMELRMQGYSWLSKLLAKPSGKSLIFFLTYIFALLGVGYLIRLIAPGLIIGRTTVDAMAAASSLGSIPAVLTCLALLSLFERAFPGVQFQGHYGDSSSRSRKILGYIALTLIIPNLVRLFLRPGR